MDTPKTILAVMLLQGNETVQQLDTELVTGNKLFGTNHNIVFLLTMFPVKQPMNIFKKSLLYFTLFSFVFVSIIVND